MPLGTCLSLVFKITCYTLIHCHNLKFTLLVISRVCSSSGLFHGNMSLQQPIIKSHKQSDQAGKICGDPGTLIRHIVNMVSGTIHRLYHFHGSEAMISSIHQWRFVSACKNPNFPRSSIINRTGCRVPCERSCDMPSALPICAYNIYGAIACPNQPSGAAAPVRLSAVD